MNKNILKRKLFTLAQWTLPHKTIDNCFMRGESSRASATSYSCERGVQRPKNTDRATECAMTNFCEKSIILFRSCFCRSALLCRQGKISCGSLRQLALHEAELKRFEPLSRISNAHYHSQRTAPSPRWGEEIDSVITDNLIDTNHSPLTTHNSHNRKFAFTLAEVLITLGIIGIVAALTLPNIINNYKRKQLEIGFKRSSSIIQQALKQTANDLGYDNFSDINSVCSVQSELNTCKSANQELFNSINANFISKFKVVKKAGGINAAKFEGKVIPTYNYIGKQGLYYSQLYGIGGGGYFLSDGTYVTGLAFFYHGSGDGITLSFDTNGPYKGPNRHGYDIFIYTTGRWGLLCSKEKSLPGADPNSSYNGRGCYQYAQKDVNPDDKTKGYWESLY